MVVVAVSKDYISSVHFDLTKLFNGNVNFLDDPVLPLSGDDLRICKKYIDLASDVLSSNVALKREATGSLISSIFYVLGSIWQKKLVKINNGEPLTHNSLRVKSVFDEFIKLVTMYHTSERRMSFYASKLCLTPKYLSKLIKQASGRSAPDWIDSFVILEAKNMLKYSDISIKEIVYKLHFANQSVFYKFFKSHTGITPSEYRNS
jgi:YesN/AraC family two-component response regulator